MKIFSLLIILQINFSVTHAQDSSKIISEECTYNGFPLYGKIQVVDSFPDLTVQIVESFPDLKVKVVESFPDECGKWKFVDSFPDIEIQFVDSFPDIKIKFVESFPGKAVNLNRKL